MLEVGKTLGGKQLLTLGFTTMNGQPLFGRVVFEDNHHYHVRVTTWQSWKAFICLPVLNTITFLFPKQARRRKLTLIKGARHG